jgi:hypothetical protein
MAKVQTTCRTVPQPRSGRAALTAVPLALLLLIAAAAAQAAPGSAAHAGLAGFVATPQVQPVGSWQERHRYKQHRTYKHHRKYRDRSRGYGYADRWSDRWRHATPYGRAYRPAPQVWRYLPGHGFVLQRVTPRHGFRADRGPFGPKLYRPAPRGGVYLYFRLPD